MLTNYIMSDKENINSPEGKCNSLYGVIGKPFIGGAYYIIK